MRHFACLLCACLLFSHTGCGSQSQSTGTAKTDGSGAADSGTLADSAAPTDGGGVDADAGDAGTADLGAGGGDVGAAPAGALRTSFVSAHSWSAGGQKSSTMTAMFLDQIPSPFVAKLTNFGPCEVRTYSKSTAGTSKLSFQQAGAILVSGGAKDALMEPGPNKQYAGWQSANEAIFVGGETLTFAAAGGTLPGFKATLVTPAHVTVTAPTYSRGNKLKVDRSQDLSVKWQGDSSGELVFKIGGPPAADLPSTNVTCRFPAGDGEGAVPKAALSAIEGFGTGVMSARMEATTKVQAGDWGQVEITANCDGLTPWKTNWGVAATFD